MNDTKQYIYVLCDELGRIKFGITNNLIKYINQSVNSSKEKIKEYYIEACSNARIVELKLLKYFANYKIDGTEWITQGFNFFDIINKTKDIIKEVDDK